MVLNLAIAAVSSLAVLVLSTFLARAIGGGNTLVNATVQFTSMIGLGVLLMWYGIVGVVGLLVVALAPLWIRVVALAYLYIQGRRALDGAFGDEAQWAAELLKEGDMEFLEAAENLPNQEVTEIRIIAESKQDLRDLTVERYEELRES